MASAFGSAVEADLVDRIRASPEYYDPAMIPVWDSPTSDAFAVLRLDPWRLRVFPGTVLLQGTGDVLPWSA